MSKTQLSPLNILLITLLLFHTHVIICYGVSVAGLGSLEASDLEAMARVCPGKIGECAAMADGEEEEMDSENNRRVLVMQKNYISYGTLKRDLVPCTTPGASYYNCKGQANPYNRGCEVITGCARSISDIKS